MNLTCIVCPVGCKITACKNGDQWMISGNRCSKGYDFALSEMTDPKRSLCTTMKTSDPDMPRLPVRTDNDIPLAMIFPVMELINCTELTHPVLSGDILLENVLGTGANIISTCSMQ